MWNCERRSLTKQITEGYRESLQIYTKHGYVVLIIKAWYVLPVSDLDRSKCSVHHIGMFSTSLTTWTAIVQPQPHNSGNSYSLCFSWCVCVNYVINTIYSYSLHFPQFPLHSPSISLSASISLHSPVCLHFPPFPSIPRLPELPGPMEHMLHITTIVRLGRGFTWIIIRIISMERENCSIERLAALRMPGWSYTTWAHLLTTSGCLQVKCCKCY